MWRSLIALAALAQTGCSVALQRRGVLTADRRLLLRTAGGATASALVQPGAAAAALPKTWDLGGGVKMPTLALNTVGLSADATEQAVLLALDAGISHVDFHPDRERDGVAKVLKRVPRDSLFLTTKVRSQQGNAAVTPAQAADLARKQLEDDRATLGVDRVDMWLLRDSPNCEVMRAQWSVLEDAQRAGSVGAIGLVNYCEKQLACLLETARVKPAVNYYMLHAGMGKDAHGLRSYGESRGIRTFAYGAVGEPGPSRELLESAVLRDIAKRHGASPEQVAVRWLLQIGCAVSARPTLDFKLGASSCLDDGSCARGLRDRAATFSIALSAAEMKAIGAMAAPDQVPALFSRACNPDLGSGSAADPLRL